MSERDLRRIVQAIDPEHDAELHEPSDAEFEIEMRAWHAAVHIGDYLTLFRSGAVLSTNIYGEPYAATMDAMRDCALSDQLATKIGELTLAGLQAVEFAKPDLDTLFPGYAVRPDAEVNGHFGEPVGQSMMLEFYFKKLLDQLFNGGLREVLTIGVKGYLDQVPDSAQLFSYLAPDGSRTYISQDGYVSTGMNPIADPERPLSQRGRDVSGFLRSEYDTHQATFDAISMQLDFLETHTERFSFDQADLLGYRPKKMGDADLGHAWNNQDEF